MDHIDLGAAARTENYEIAAYEGLRRMAKAFGEDEAVGASGHQPQAGKALREVEKIATRLSHEAVGETVTSRA